MGRLLADREADCAHMGSVEQDSTSAAPHRIAVACLWSRRNIVTTSFFGWGSKPDRKVGAYYG